MARSAEVSESSEVVDLSEFVNRRPGPPCRVGEAFKKLDEEQQAKLQAALDTKKITTATIRRVFEGWLGTKFNPSSFQRHRDGDCACGR